MLPSVTQRIIEDRPAVHCGLGPNAPAMALHNTLRERESYPRPFVLLAAVQPLEHAKKLGRILHLEPHAVIPDKIHLLALPLVTAHLDARYRSLAGKLQRVAQQDCPSLLQQCRV